jgi:CheY-like chemotaxis protein
VEKTNSQRPDALIVGDHADTLMSMRESLTLLGFNVTAADSGPAALAKATANPPKLVLLDIRTPGMDGFQVASRLRQLPGMDRTPLVAVTGSIDVGFVARAQAAGFDAFLAKPIDQNLLEQILRNYDLTIGGP